MKQTLLISLLLSAACLTASSQALVFADQFSGNDTQSSSSVAADHSENVFIATVFYSQMDADPGPGVTQLTAVGSADVALTKLSSTGDLLWDVQLGGTGFETAKKVVTDNEGNAIICGYFHNTIDFDPSASVYNLTATGGEDGFLAKYDASGNFIWAHKIGSAGTEEFYGLDVDSSGNVYTMGYFQNTIDFDPGAGVTNLAAIGGNALFIWKLDKDGNFTWAKQIAYVFGNDLMLDANANIIITGAFYGTTDFNPGIGTFNLTATGFGNDAFIMKLDKDGIFQWAGKMSGASEEAGLCIGFDHAGNILVGGRYESTVDFDPGSGTTNLTAIGYYDAFVECFTGAGAYVWVKSFGGAGYDEVSSIQTDAQHNIHLGGAFEQTCDFDASNNSFNLTSNGYTDGYLAVWDSSANFTSAFQIGGALDDGLLKMVLDDEGGILCSGYFQWTTDFDPGADTTNLTTFTGWDGFAAKYCTAYTIQSFVSICEGDSFYAAGAYQTAAGDYYDYYVPSVGCDSTVITHLSVNHPVVNLGNDTSICENNQLQLDAGNAGATYLWSNGLTTQTIAIINGGIFSVTVTDAAGCSAHDTISVTVNPLPEVDLGGDASLCAGDSTQLDAGNAGAVFLWSTGETSQTITVSTASSYTVTVTNANGCSSSDTVVVTAHPLPIITFLGSTDTLVCYASNSIQLPFANPAGGNYSGDGVNGSSFNPALAGLGDHIITYTFTDGFGCTGADSFTVTVEVCTGASDAISNQTFIYPNPSTGIMVIERKNFRAATFDITDVSGKILRQINLPAAQFAELDLSNLPEGIYFLTQEETSLRNKIVIARR